MASESSSGEKVENASSKVEVGRVFPSTNLRFNMAVNTGRPGSILWTQFGLTTGSVFHPHLFQVPITGRRSDQHRQVRADLMDLLRYGHGDGRW